MGGRGSNSNMQTRMPAVSHTPQPIAPQMNQPITQQPPTDQNTPVQPAAVTNLSQMTDAQLAQLARQAQSIDMPNALSDIADQTQRFVFAAGINEKPIVLDDAAFKQYMSDNGISQAQVLTRSVIPISYQNKDGTTVHLSANDVIDMMKYSRLNYIGGKKGGQAYGAGTYFDMIGGRNTGYGNTTATAVLNPATAKIIDDRTLAQKAKAFSKTHPQFTRVVGAYDTRYKNNNMSIYALAMGYNVIKDHYGSYHNVIDRSALVYKQSNS